MEPAWYIFSKFIVYEKSRLFSTQFTINHSKNSAINNRDLYLVYGEKQMTVFINVSGNSYSGYSLAMEVKNIN